MMFAGSAAFTDARRGFRLVVTHHGAQGVILLTYATKMHRHASLTPIPAITLACLTLLVASNVAGSPAGAVQAERSRADAEPSGSARTTTLNDREIHYESHGEMRDDRPALVLVHGWASSTWAWHRQLPGLASLGRVLALDLPGHGRSAETAADQDYTVDLFADAIRAVMDDAGVERAVIVGHSNGTPVAVRFYRAYPERTAALVAVDGPLTYLATNEMVEGVVAPLREDGYRDVVTQLVAGMAGSGLTQADVEGITVMALATPQRTLVEAVLATSDAASWSDDPIDVPVLALLAEQPTWSDEYRVRIERLAPRLDWVVWQNVSHFLMLERPGAFQAELSRFLAAVDQSRR